MAKKSNKIRGSFWDRFKRGQTTAAGRTMFEEFFQDMYGQRWRVYKMNFIRGLFFGLGSVLGGTILITLLVWVLAQVGAVVPFLSDFIQQILDSLGGRVE